jgi:hypothetical protein
MKGLSNYISHALIVMLGFIIVTFFTTALYRIYDKILVSNMQAGLKQVTIQTMSGINYLYDESKKSNAAPTNSSSVVISDITLNYPEKISGRNFEVELISSPGIWNVITNLVIGDTIATINKETESGSKIIAKTTQKPLITYEYDAPNIPVKLQGKFKSGVNDTLRVVRYNYNGTIENIIILGESNIIIGITGTR